MRALLVAIVGVGLLALWPTKPVVPVIDSQDKYVEIGENEGFFVEEVPLFSQAHVKVLRSKTFDYHKKTIVFLHGFPDNFYSFSNQMMFFKQDYNVLSVSLRGYDKSSSPFSSSVSASSSSSDESPLLVSNLANDLIIVLDFYKFLSPVHVVGHDWGCIVAQLAVKLHPERFETITMLAVPHIKRQEKAFQKNPSQLVNSWYMFFFQLPYLPEWWFTRNDFAGFEWLFRSWGNGINTNSARIESIKRTYREGGEEVLAAIIGYYRENIFSMFWKQAKQRWYSLPPTPADGDIPRPALLLHGDRDWCMLPKLWEAATNRSDFKEGVDDVLVLNAGHFLHQDNPDEVNKLIRHLINDHATTSRL